MAATHPEGPPAVPQALPSKAPRYYRPELDVLRCLAFLMVFSSHMPTLANPGHLLSLVEECGAAGVCVFFTLSAYLITELLLRERESTGTIHRGAFYTRRILRIWPLYFTAVLISVLAAHFYHRWTAQAHFVIPYLLLSGNIAVSTLGHYPRNGLLAPLWSISVEEQFYLLWPLLLWWRGRAGVRVAVAILLPLAWLTDVLVPLTGGSRDPVLWNNSLSQFQYFAIGALLALLLHRHPLRVSRAGRVGMILVAAACFALAAQPLHFLFPVGAARPAPILGAYLLLDCACALLLVGILGARVPRWAEPLRHLGKISYGLYVFHYTLWIGIGAAVTRLMHRPLAPLLPALYLIVLAATIVLAELSYRFLEKPFLRIKERLAFIPSRAT